MDPLRDLPPGWQTSRLLSLCQPPLHSQQNPQESALGRSIHSSSSAQTAQTLTGTALRALHSSATHRSASILGGDPPVMGAMQQQQQQRPLEAPALDLPPACHL